MSAELITYSPPRDVVVSVRLNQREGPARDRALRRRLQPAQVLKVDAQVLGEDFLGEAHWFREATTGLYFWAGGARLVEVAPQTGGDMRVHRRADGSIRPLGNAELERVFGRFDFAERGNGAIRITTPGWAENHLRSFAHRVLGDADIGALTVHAKAHAAFEGAFERIAGAGLGDRVRTCAGTFVARHKGWDPRRDLSSHSWGVAIDLNVAWNAYGVEPALQGMPGCVRELVPHFAAEGFAWGGHFSGRDRDGMHFELARLDL